VAKAIGSKRGILRAGIFDADDETLAAAAVDFERKAILPGMRRIKADRVGIFRWSCWKIFSTDLLRRRGECASALFVRDVVSSSS